MALISSSSLTISSSSNIFDFKAPYQSSQCVSLSTLSSLPLLSHNHAFKTTSHCKLILDQNFTRSRSQLIRGQRSDDRKIGRDVTVMSTGDAPAEVSSAETPEFVKNLQEAWDKVDDKYAVSSLVIASVIALWSSTGLISAIDKLPLIPGVLELIGIGYTGWFAYKNLVFKPEREELIGKVKETITEIIGSK